MNKQQLQKLILKEVREAVKEIGNPFDSDRYRNWMFSIPSTKGDPDGDFSDMSRAGIIKKMNALPLEKAKEIYDGFSEKRKMMLRHGKAISPQAIQFRALEKRMEEEGLL